MEWLDELGTAELLQAIEMQMESIWPSLSLQQLFQDFLQGNLQLDWMELGKALGDALMQAATAQFSVLGQLIVLAVVAALLHQLEGNFAKSNVQKISALTIQAVAVLLIIQGAAKVLTEAAAAVTRLTGIMELLLPVQFLLMVGLGNLKSAGLLQPSLVIMVQGAAFFFKNIVVPLITMELLLKLVNSFSDTYNLSGLAAFLRKAILTSISFCVMLFLAILSIEGISGQALDRLSLRTVKYVTGSAVPVVGGMLSGLMDTLLSGGLMIRSALGLVGLLVILILTVLPALKILLLYFLYSFTAAVLQPLGNSRMTALLEQTAGSFMLLFAVVALTGVLFFFMVLIVLAASGASL